MKKHLLAFAIGFLCQLLIWLLHFGFSNFYPGFLLKPLLVQGIATAIALVIAFIIFIITDFTKKGLPYFSAILFYIQIIGYVFATLLVLLWTRDAYNRDKENPVYHHEIEGYIDKGMILNPVRRDSLLNSMVETEGWDPENLERYKMNYGAAMEVFLDSAMKTWKTKTDTGIKITGISFLKMETFINDEYYPDEVIITYLNPAFEAYVFTLYCNDGCLIYEHTISDGKHPIRK